MKEVIKKIPLREVDENYTVSVIVYDYDGANEILEYLVAKNRDFVVSRMFTPRNENGFTMENDEGGLIIYINKESEKPAELILVHELFHVAYKLSEIMDSEEYGARIYSMLYKEFMEGIKTVD